MKRIQKLALIWVLTIMSTQITSAQDCCAKGKNVEKDSKTSISQMASSQYELVDQEGNKHLLGNLIKDKVVVMNFIFTSCKTICPPMGANFAALKKELGDRANENLVMLSVSIDPSTDTPQRMKVWQENFNTVDDNIWTMLTGDKKTVEQLLMDLEVFTPLIDEHAPIIIMGSADGGDWIRTNGLASPEILAKKVTQYLDKAKEDFTTNADINYFTDLELVDQNGESFKFYSDLMKDKIVFINPFFADCPGSCPIMHTMMKDVQKHLGDKLGSSVVMLSITVDPVNDTPKKLKAYADRFEAKPGWHFLSGSVQNVNTVMQKLGKYVENREQHDAIILIGNLKTRLWKKTNGLANVSEIIAVLDSVIDDVGDTE